MKKLRPSAALVAVLSLVALPGGFAAEGPKARIFTKYDANKNGVIDGDEVAAVRKAFAADPKGEFAGYDKDHDGKLSDEEITSIKPPGGKKAGEKKTGGKKSDAAKPSEPDKKADAK